MLTWPNVGTVNALLYFFGSSVWFHHGTLPNSAYVPTELICTVLLGITSNGAIANSRRPETPFKQCLYLQIVFFFFNRTQVMLDDKSYQKT